MTMGNEPPASWQDRVIQELDEEGGSIQLATEGQTKAVWAVKSNSDPMDFYYIIDVGWIVLCTCKGFRFRTDCSHARDYTDKKLARGVDTPHLHSVD